LLNFFQKNEKKCFAQGMVFKASELPLLSVDGVYFEQASYGMRGCMLFLLDLMLIAGGMYAQNPTLEWPVEKNKKYQISSTFGESRLDHFHNGIDLPGEGFTVLSPRDGRLLYRINAEAIPGEMPFGGGNTIVLDHGDIWTGYMHLKSVPENIGTEAPIARAEKIAISGNTGHSGGPHLHFFVYQPAERAMLNPLLLMGDTYYRDTKPPLAKEWGILLTDKFVTINPAKPFRMTADYPVYLLLQDQGIARERWGVYAYRVLLDDKEAINVRFDKIVHVDGIWRLTAGYCFEDIFYRNFYSLTPQVRRSKRVSVEAKDLKGNTFAQTYGLQIQQN
jgi:murein DD-endopeptidase MepM/ murein hydrolase activator NlpD